MIQLRIEQPIKYLLLFSLLAGMVSVDRAHAQNYCFRPGQNPHITQVFSSDYYVELYDPGRVLGCNLRIYSNSRGPFSASRDDQWLRTYHIPGAGVGVRWATMNSGIFTTVRKRFGNGKAFFGILNTYDPRSVRVISQQFISPQILGPGYYQLHTWISGRQALEIIEVTPGRSDLSLTGSVAGFL